MRLSPGTRLGPYEILAPLGAGGMGEVYRARDSRLERIVAVKVIPPLLALDAKIRERFEREARIVSNLNHPHICTIHDIGHIGGVDFLVMELIEGESLAARLARGPLSLDQVLRIAIEVGDALDKAHRQGVVHRDLKPGNIMLGKGGAKLLDFGLAKIAAGPGGGTGLSALATSPMNLTSEGTIVGTLQYMAPEQLEGREADRRTDIFAFGAALYEMATGRKAFEGRSQASVISAIMASDPPPLSNVETMPPALARVVTRCLAKDPEDRWQSARDLTSELEWIAGGGSESGMPAPLAVVRRAKSRARLAWTLAAVATVAAVLATMFVMRGWNPVEADAIRFAVDPPAQATFGGSSLAVSPDGRHLAFVARGADRIPHLWLRSFDALDARMLPETEEASQPFWAPDSRFIGFLAQGQLKKIEISGGVPQTVTRDLLGTRVAGTWNRDGTIVFAQGSGPLFRVAATGGAAARATELDAARGDHAHRWPHFLPDGRHFLYLAVGGSPSDNEVRIGSLDAPAATGRLAGITSEAVYSPAGYLFFVRDGTLSAQPFDAKGLTLSGEAIPIAQRVSFDTALGRPAFSAGDTGVLAYRTDGDLVGMQFVWVDRAGRSLGHAGAPGEQLNAELSPDGTKVALERTGAERAVWMLDLGRAVSTRLTFGSGVDAFPVWSPDGNRVAFGSTRDNALNLYQRQSSGAGQDELILANATTPLCWSPDGRFVVYMAVDVASGSADLWLLPMTGDGKPVSFLRSAFRKVHAQVSPDSQWIAYSSNESGRHEVYLQSFPTPGGKWQVSTGGGSQPRWRGDGKELFYLAPDSRLMAVPVKLDARPEIGVPTALFQTHLFGGAAVFLSIRAQYNVTADGQRFLLNVDADDNASPISTIINWPAGLKR